MKRWCAGGGAFGAAQAVHLWTMRFAHRPACRGQRIRVAHRAGLRPQAPQPPTTINEPVSQLWSYRGDKYSDAGGLFDEHFVSIADRHSLPPRGGLPLAQWLARPHVLVATRPDVGSEIDLALGAQGLRRRVAVVLPHWRASLDVLPGTDLILTVASRTVDHAPRDRRLRAFTPPLDLPRFAFQQAWHARRDADAAHCWFRGLVKACSQPGSRATGV